MKHFYRLKIPLTSLVLTLVNKGIRMLNGLLPRRGPGVGEITTTVVSLAIDLPQPCFLTHLPASLRHHSGSGPVHLHPTLLPWPCPQPKYSYSSGGINAFMVLIGRDSRSGKENQNMVEWTERILGSHWQM